MTQSTRTLITSIAAVAAAALTLTACAGEGGSGENTGDGNGSSVDTLSIDYATYNPLSLIIKEQGWLEEELEADGVDVEWVFSAGSNKANENLRANAIDVGSTAGSAALLSRSTGTPIKTIDVVGNVEWTALVAAEDSDITEVTDLEGSSVAATRGTDPYFFLVQALDEAGVDLNSVEVQNLQHADGRTALQNGSVDAWAGLDPIMASAESEGANLFYRNVDLNTYSFLNATESFIEESPELAQLVVDTYERARAWALENPDETAQILADEADIDLELAQTVIGERSGFDISPVPGDDQYAVLERIAPIFVSTGDVDDQATIDTALEELFEPRFAEAAADPADADDTEE
ncbi:aliphatic sulfonate ABC transporter substrate-binding protein [Citricoccus muralis]|uniref:Aliphatic sulfonate ABC transporter substrate-binding protein n=1 Tax=Citricoccus muralis TaxID=169134 RepID=A0ABY8H788_9MICC|nr:aliphatic sulfonate ABC transporter substrate-binding protein [Citricoccus muralis]WFP17018.1 aliphatic sulfonate ABC transporter substrate-binding protein [Citricoccus muralis]